MKRLLSALTAVLAVYSVTALKNVSAEAASPEMATPAPQTLDDQYTKLIKEYLQDLNITTELVYHMPVLRAAHRSSCAHIGVYFSADRRRR